MKFDKDNQHDIRFAKIQTFVAGEALAVQLLPHPHHLELGVLPGPGYLAAVAKEGSRAGSSPILPTNPKMADGLTLTLNSTDR